MCLQCARVSILRAEKENGYSDVALILGLVLAWAKADFLLFTSKIVEHSRHLPLTKCETEPLRRAFTTLIRSSVINSSWQLNPALVSPFRVDIKQVIQKLWESRYFTITSVYSRRLF